MGGIKEDEKAFSLPNMPLRQLTLFYPHPPLTSLAFSPSHQPISLLPPL